MSITHSAAAIAAATDAVTALVAGGVLRLLEDTTTLVDIELGNPAFGAADGSGIATLEAVTPVDATGATVTRANKFEIRTSAGVATILGKAGMKRAIAAVSQGSKTISVAVNIAAQLAAGDTVRVSDSTGNDGYYTVVSAVYSAPNTVVTVVEALPHATGDGNLHPFPATLDNDQIAIGQQVSVSSLTYKAIGA